MATIAEITTPYNQDPVDHVSVPIAQVLPVDPMAWGNVTLVDAGISFDGVGFYIPAALQSEGSRMEKRKGQIWPR